MTNTVKSQRDAYHDKKRSNAEKLIFQELRFIRNLGKESYRVARRNSIEISNLRKCFDAIQEVIGPEEVNKMIAKADLQTIPEEDELIYEAEIEEMTEKDCLIDLSDASLIIDEDSAEEQLFGEITNPDSSVEVDKVMPLTEQQEILRSRRLQLEKEISTASINLLPDGPWSYKAYQDLQEEVHNAFSPVEIAAPSNPAKFKKRYGHSWQPHMTLHTDFGGSRAEGPRLQKDKGWKEKVKEEKEKLEAEAKQVPKPKLRSNSKNSKSKNNNLEDKPPKDKGVGKKSVRKFIQEPNPADDEDEDNVFDSDDSFNKPGPSKPRKRKISDSSHDAHDAPESKKSKLNSV